MSYKRALVVPLLLSALIMTPAFAATYEIDKVKKGDKVGDMTVKAVEKIKKDEKLWKEVNTRVKFKGQQRISGTYQYFGANQGPRSDKVCITEVDKSSLDKLPQEVKSAGKLAFCFSNQPLAKKYYPKGASGKTDVIIGNLVVNHDGTDLSNTARLLRIKSFTKAAK